MLSFSFLCIKQQDILNKLNESGGIYLQQRLKIEVRAASVPPEIITTALPDGTVGTPYSATLSATGDETITWAVSAGVLPDGLSLSAEGTVYCRTQAGNR